MIAVTILVLMMAIGWGTVVQTMRANKHFGGVQDRFREARAALGRMAADLSMAYISGNEDRTMQEPRTFFVGEASGDVASVRFSAFAHTRLYADANESDQTIIAYFGASDPVNRSQNNLMRRESRRMPNQERWDAAPGATDIIFSGVTRLRISYFDVRDKEWKESWSTQGVEGSANRMPDRVRISLTFLDEEGKEITLTTQARVYLQEMLQFYAN
jgi:general secretion pathway protein J